MKAKAGYEPLAAILSQALDQAQDGKGHQRHAQEQPFVDQPMQKLIDLYGPGFALGQAAKKMQEAQRLQYEHARAELLGAINYAAGAVIALDRKNLPVLNAVTVNGSEEELAALLADAEAKRDVWRMEAEAASSVANDNAPGSDLKITIPRFVDIPYAVLEALHHGCEAELLRRQDGSMQGKAPHG